MEDRRSSFKRRPNPLSERGGNKRGRFSDQSSESSHSSETVYRILCHSRKIGSVIGKGGIIVKSLREETQAKITVADSIPGSEERVILIYSPSTKKPVTHYSDDNIDLECAAQDALLKVHDRIVEEDIVGGPDYNENVVIARLLVPNNTVGCLLGKKGDVIQRLRSETGANIRVLPAEQLPVCAMTTDELVQISAKPGIARRALYEVSALLHRNPRKDKPPSGFPVPVGRHPPIMNLPPPPNPMWSSPPRGGWRSEYDGGGEELPPLPPTEFWMKILCPTARIGGVIGKGGSNVRQLQQETGTDIHVDDVSADVEERVIRVSSFEALWNPRSRTIDAILILQDKTCEHSEKGTITTRLLIPSSKVGCILGQGGQVINEMRRRTKADIRVYSREEKPKCAGEDEELVQVSGSHGNAKDALAEIASRYRARCLRDAKPAPEPAAAPVPAPPRRNLGFEAGSRSRGGRSGGYDPFKGGGREYEPPTYAPTPRDYEHYSHPPPTRDYEPYTPRSASARDYEAYTSSHPPPTKDYDPRAYRPPPREYEPHPHAYPSPPPREYEPQGYSLPPSAIPSGYPGDVNLKSGRASAIANASEMVGTRLKYGGGSESIDSYQGQGYGGQKRPLQTSYHDDYAPRPQQYAADPHTQHPPPYHNYQNNPPNPHPHPQQGRYSDTPYQY